MADLVTPEEVAATLGADYGGRADLALLISAASQVAEAYCDRVFGEGEADEYIDGTGTDTIHLRRWPVASIASIEVDGFELDNSGGLAWTVDLERGAVHRGQGRVDPRFACGWPLGRRNVRVQYQGGEADVPPKVKFAVLSLVRWLADSATYGAALRSEAVGDHSYTIAASLADRDQMPGFIQALLDDYRRIPI